jgi:RNA polymerase sigma-70 factor (ECF subfamily)
VLQDSLLAAWKAAGSYRGDSRVITWLLGIVHHQALNATRRKRLPVVEPMELLKGSLE